MALVREPMVMCDGGFDAEASVFDALGYGGHDALLGGLDTAALFRGYAYARDEPAGAASAYAPESPSWAGAGASMLASPAASTIGLDPATGCFSLTQSSGGASRPLGLQFPSMSNGSPDAAGQARCSSKRSHAARVQDAEPRATKKRCGASRKTSKAKPVALTTTSPKGDPQSLTAKNRREKINERLRTLQELVPNGTKVDMVTMLEKAVSYVQFLQLQVKVLATDEFWPAQGGTAPEISQVKEALDAILSPQRGQLL
ncbi:transcription factor bHLH119-like [Triticum aestivum]|uniref:transcription factor bHLH119-like n=1 Tax=Triticum aestivum TaxID=4565 RepID=UPI001D021EB6|nr:transcription factor bHLH119-like [Triticum aestivum]